MLPALLSTGKLFSLIKSQLHGHSSIIQKSTSYSTHSERKEWSLEGWKILLLQEKLSLEILQGTCFMLLLSGLGHPKKWRVTEDSIQTAPGMVRWKFSLYTRGPGQWLRAREGDLRGGLPVQSLRAVVGSVLDMLSSLCPREGQASEEKQN